ncbi:MAG: M15 family metallopeptidase [Deltaproteobacteria bacterium]|nr:M15 family metallopeptidase [Deltaproteobacteria bacterium]
MIGLALTIALAVLQRPAPELGHPDALAPEALAPAPTDHMKCLADAYPDVVCGADGASLVLCAGGRIPWDDGRGDKRYRAFLEEPDLEEMMRMRYRPGRDFPVPHVNFEPGRVRHEPFFFAVYGADRRAIERQMVDVPWMPRRGGTSVLRVHRRVAPALQRVSDELERALSDDLAALARVTAGAFTWRTVRGSKRVSMHSFGIAIDIGVKRSDYWDWKKPDAHGRYAWRNRFPWEIAAVFERHGFIWGAKWYHFDTMHFEYRPELLAAPCVDGR